MNLLKQLVTEPIEQPTTEDRRAAMVQEIKKLEPSILTRLTRKQRNKLLEKKRRKK